MDTKMNNNEPDIVDAEFTMKPKNSAVAMRQALGITQPSFEAPKQKWEDLEEIFQESAKGIIETGNNINVALKVPGVQEFVTDKEEMNTAVRGLTRDLQTFAEKLASIHKKHEGRTGFIDEAADLANCLSIFDEYVNFSTQYKAVTLPTVLTIMDHIGSACENISKQLPADDSSTAAQPA